MAVFGLFVVLATLVSYEYSRDSANYIRMFQIYGASGWSVLFKEVFHREIFLLVTSKVFYSLGVGVISIFLIHAVISLSIKFYLIDRFSKNKWLSLALFASYFFILHDSTQIRFSLAVAFAYLSLIFLVNDKRILFSLAIIVSALVFHIAVLSFLVMLLFTSRESYVWTLLMIVVAILLYFTHFNYILVDAVSYLVNLYNLKGTFLNKLLDLYLLHEGQTAGLGILNWRVFLVYLCAGILFRYRNQFSKYELLCFNALLLSIFVYIFMKDVIEIQYRISSFFGFSLVFLVPYIHDWLSERLSRRDAYIILLVFNMLYLVKFALFEKMIVI